MTFLATIVKWIWLTNPTELSCQKIPLPSLPVASLLRFSPWRFHPSRGLSLPSAENLELNPDPHEIPHPDIGRYFEEFADTYYVANPELEIRYPEDMALTRLAGQKTEESQE